MASTLRAAPPTGPAALPAPPAPPARRGWITDASLLLMAVIWGINFSVLKYATGAFLPLAFNSVRLLLGTVVITAIALVATRGQPWPSRPAALTLLGLGVLGNGVYQVLFVEGVARTQAGTASLVLAGRTGAHRALRADARDRAHLRARRLRHRGLDPRRRARDARRARGRGATRRRARRDGAR
jgi:hypothetical protein